MSWQPWVLDGSGDDFAGLQAGPDLPESPADEQRFYLTEEKTLTPDQPPASDVAGGTMEPFYVRREPDAPIADVSFTASARDDCTIRSAVLTDYFADNYAENITSGGDLLCWAIDGDPMETESIGFFWLPAGFSLDASIGWFNGSGWYARAASGGIGDFATGDSVDQLALSYLFGRSYWTIDAEIATENAAALTAIFSEKGPAYQQLLPGIVVNGEDGWANETVALTPEEFYGRKEFMEVLQQELNALDTRVQTLETQNQTLLALLEQVSGNADGD
jgi:hypothetical protein